MTRTGEARAAYREYLDGKRSIDSVIDLANEWSAHILSKAPAVDPQAEEAEEAEWRRMRERSRTAPLWQAYLQSTRGKRSLDSVLDLADHMRDFLRGTPEPGEGGTGPQPSPVHEAYQRCLDGDLSLDDMLALADGYLTPRGGDELAEERG